MKCFSWTVVSVCSLSLVSVAWAQSPNEIANQVSQARYTKYQLDIQDMGLGLYGGASYNQGFRNRYNTRGSAYESKGFREATLYLTDQYASMGLDVSVQGDYKNVVAELKGTETPDKIFIISGHYDHPEYNNDCPGGDDNASGTAGVVEAARVMSQFRFKSTVRFISWGGEEGWMKGSWDYVRSVVKPLGQNVVGMLNLDMILRPGWDSNPGHVKDLDVSTGVAENCMQWAGAFQSAVERFAPSVKLNPLNPQHDDWYPGDQGPFIQEGFPGLMIAENNADDIWNKGANKYYHTKNDASDRLANDPNNGSGIVYDYGFATEVTRASVGMIAEQAEAVPEPAVLVAMAMGVSSLVVRGRRRRTA